LNTTQTLP
jgi:hypothetical protein